MPIFHTSVIFFKLLISHENFHTEHEYQAKKRQTFLFPIQVNFSELPHCKHRHQPIIMVVRSERHVHFLQQHQQWLNLCLNHNTIKQTSLSLLNSSWKSSLHPSVRQSFVQLVRRRRPSPAARGRKLCCSEVS